MMNRNGGSAPPDPQAAGIGAAARARSTLTSDKHESCSAYLLLASWSRHDETCWRSLSDMLIRPLKMRSVRIPGRVTPIDMGLRARCAENRALTESSSATSSTVPGSAPASILPFIFSTGAVAFAPGALNQNPCGAIALRRSLLPVS